MCIRDSLGEVGDEVLELLLELDATDEQLDSPIIYCSGRDGTASESPNESGKDLTVLFDKIVDYLPAPEGDEDGAFQMLISSIDYSEYVGRMLIGRIERGTLHLNQEVAVCDFHDKTAVSYTHLDVYKRQVLNRVADCQNSFIEDAAKFTCKLCRDAA